MKNTKNLLLYGIFTIFVALCGIVGGDKWYNILFSSIAVIYLLLLTENKRTGYVLCCIYALGYGFIALHTGFYATAVYHGLFLFPVSIYRFCVSSKKNVQVSIKKMSFITLMIFCFVGIVISVALYFLLSIIKDAQPILDGVILTLSLLTSATMLGNYREMWWFNLVSSVLYVVMWLIEFFSNGTGLSFAIMQGIVSIINIKGIVEWKKIERT